MSVIAPNENLAYHAARLLILLQRCGKPRKTKTDKLPGIEGRTLLAKLDFFLRYPFYLNKAAKIRVETDDSLRKEISFLDCGVESFERLVTVESQMVRYLYGPWDHAYYPVLAYMIGKDLINIERGTHQIEIFRLSKKGYEVASQLAQEDEYHDLVRRAETIYYLFNIFSGTRLKDFIYKNFPEVVNRKIGTKI